MIPRPRHVSTFPHAQAGDISGKGFVLTTSDQVTVHVESDRAPTTDYVGEGPPASCIMHGGFGLTPAGVTGSRRAPTLPAEVEGTVTGPASVRAMMVTDFGNDFDLGNYESMVALTRDKVGTHCSRSSRTRVARSVARALSHSFTQYRALFGNKEDCTWRLS